MSRPSFGELLDQLDVIVGQLQERGFPPLSTSASRPLLLTVKESRQVHSLRLHRYAADLKKRHDRILTLEKSLITLRQSQSAWRQANTPLSCLATTSYLPPEVLMNVFAKMVRDDRDARVLSQVCTQWRTIVQNQPELWSTFRSSTTTIKPVLLNQCLDFSREHQLSLASRNQPTRRQFEGRASIIGQELRTKLVEAVFSVGCGIEGLHALDSGCRSYTAGADGNREDLGFPSLEHSKIEFEDDCPTCYQPWRTASQFTPAKGGWVNLNREKIPLPKLNHLTLTRRLNAPRYNHSTELRFVPPSSGDRGFPSLNHLTIDSLKVYLWKTMTPIFRSAVTIKSLVIRDLDFVDGRGQATHVPVVLPTLRSLSFHGSKSGHDLATLLTFIDAPNLVSFEYSGNIPCTWAMGLTIRQKLSHTFLKTIKIQTSFPYIRDFIEHVLFHQDAPFSHLKHLSILLDSSDPDHPSWHWYRRNPSLLSHYPIHHTQFVDDFHAWLERHRETHGLLETLRVMDCFTEEKRTDTFADKMELERCLGCDYEQRGRPTSTEL